MRLAVTGANGLVGRHVIAAARARGWDVVGTVRNDEAAKQVVAQGAEPRRIDGLTETALGPAFAGADAVVHLAMVGSEKGDATYEAVNVLGTRAVGRAAVAAGIGAAVVFSGLGVARYGMTRYTTNPYFLSKWAAELELFRQPLGVTVFRPSYIVGKGDGLMRALHADFVKGVVEIPGDGAYRMQPIAVKDAAALVVEALATPPRQAHRVFDLVGPEPIAYRALIDRTAAAARREQGRQYRYEVRSVPLDEVLAAAAQGAWHGMPADELDCLLCDEVSDARPLESLLGRFLTPLDEALAAAQRGIAHSS